MGILELYRGRGILGRTERKLRYVRLFLEHRLQRAWTRILPARVRRVGSGILAGEPQQRKRYRNILRAVPLDLRGLSFGSRPFSIRHFGIRPDPDPDLWPRSGLGGRDDRAPAAEGSASASRHPGPNDTLRGWTGGPSGPVTSGEGPPDPRSDPGDGTAPGRSPALTARREAGPAIVPWPGMATDPTHPTAPGRPHLGADLAPVPPAHASRRLHGGGSIPSSSRIRPPFAAASPRK